MRKGRREESALCVYTVCPMGELIRANAAYGRVDLCTRIESIRFAEHRITNSIQHNKPTSFRMVPNSLCLDKPSVFSPMHLSPISSDILQVTQDRPGHTTIHNPTTQNTETQTLHIQTSDIKLYELSLNHSLTRGNVWTFRSRVSSRLRRIVMSHPCQAYRMSNSTRFDPHWGRRAVYSQHPSSNYTCVPAVRQSIPIPAYGVPWY